MGNFVVKNQMSNVQFEFTNSTMIVHGMYVKDATTNKFQSYTGQCYRKNAQGQQGEYFGNYNGYLRDGSSEVKYSMSEMSRRDSNLVWDAIDEIEPYVLGTDSNTEE
jgi:hypothetical protein